MQDFEVEVERLKAKKLELVSKLNLTSDFDEKEEYEKRIESLERQIRLLEKLKGSL